MQKITSHLWFHDQAEEAVQLYTSVFKNAKVLSTSHYSEAASKMAGRPAGSVMTIVFELEGQIFMALNGGPAFTFNESVSFMINCQDQAEVDYFYDHLATDGEIQPCGWIKDKFGLSWQIVPKSLGELMSGGGEKSERVMEALLGMKKIDIAELEKAAAL